MFFATKVEISLFFPALSPIFDAFGGFFLGQNTNSATSGSLFGCHTQITGIREQWRVFGIQLTDRIRWYATSSIFGGLCGAGMDGWWCLSVLSYVDMIPHKICGCNEREMYWL